MKKILLLAAACFFAAITSFADPVQPGHSCETATDITSPSNVTYTTFGATGSGKAAYYSDAAGDDVWFKFTPAALQAYGIALTNGADYAGGVSAPSFVMELWTECGDALYSSATDQSFFKTPVLTSGHTYYLRVYTVGTGLRGNFKISVFAANAVANDEPAGAVTLTPGNTCAATGPYSTLGATKTNLPSGDASGSDDDVWFKFTTGTENLGGSVTISDDSTYNSGGPVVELWQNLAGSNIGFFPFSHAANLGTLQPNTTYYVRVYTYGSAARLKRFNICVALVVAPPTNDNFFNAVPITINPGATCTTTITGGSTKNATQDGGPGCRTGTVNDVWYKFTATTATATISLTNVALLPGGTNTTNTKLWMQAYETSNTAPPRGCVDNNTFGFDGSSALLTLTVGKTYYIRIYNDEPGNASTFNICTQSPPPPPYDVCATPINIKPSLNESCDNSVALNNLNATASGPSGCLGNVGSDVWLRFTAPDYDNLQVNLTDYEKLTGSATPFMGIAVYSGTCDVLLTSVACTSAKTLNLPALTHGGQYFIRIIFFDAADAGKFKVCLHAKSPAATNIRCSDAVTMNSGGEATTPFINTSFGGVAINDTLKDCNGFTFTISKSLWFKFTATAAEELIDIQNIKSLNDNPNVTVGYRFYIDDGTGNCDKRVAFACKPDVRAQNEILSGLVPGKVYLIEVLINTYQGGDASFGIRAINTAAPHNNEPAGADQLIQNPVYTASMSMPGSFKFSTITSNPPAAATGTYAGDVWYKFKAATTDPTVKINYNNLYTRIQVYDHTHAGTPVYDAGADNTENHLTGLTIDETYYIRVYNTQASNATTAGSIFYINVYGTPSKDAASIAPVGANCVTTDGTVTSNNSQKWLHITKGGKMVASIFDNVTMGTINAGYYINSGSLRETPAHVSYLDRNFSLTPTIHPAVPVIAMFYFTKQEFDKLTGSPTGHVNYLNDLTIAAFSGEACATTIASAGETDYGILDYGSLSSDVYYIEVSIPHFSSFFIKSGFGVTLPVVCHNFTASVKNTQVQLNWQTASEQHSNYFEVQRSDNGVDFATLGTVAAAGNSNTMRYYSYTDVTSKLGGNYYYRLKQVDLDGQNRFACGTVRVSTANAGNELFGRAYPNPAVSSVTINIQKAYTGRVTVQVVNTMGQLLSQKVITVNNSTGQISLPVYNLPAGSYNIRLITKEATVTKQFTKAK